MDALVKALAIRLVESTTVLEAVTRILISQNYPKTSALVKEHVEANIKLLDEIKESMKE